MIVIAFLIATPELGLEGGVSCGVCHLDPVGGGLRAGPGFGIGVRKIPFSPRHDYVPPYLNEAETITYGGDLRVFLYEELGGPLYLLSHAGGYVHRGCA